MESLSVQFQFPLAARNTKIHFHKIISQTKTQRLCSQKFPVLQYANYALYRSCLPTFGITIVTSLSFLYVDELIENPSTSIAIKFSSTEDNLPRSFPKPDCLKPPKGAATSVLLYVFTKQVPASILLAVTQTHQSVSSYRSAAILPTILDSPTSRALLMLFVKTPEANP